MVYIVLLSIVQGIHNCVCLAYLHPNKTVSFLLRPSQNCVSFLLRLWQNINTIKVDPFTITERPARPICKLLLIVRKTSRISNCYLHYYLWSKRGQLHSEQSSRHISIGITELGSGSFRMWLSWWVITLFMILSYTICTHTHFNQHTTCSLSHYPHSVTNMLKIIIPKMRTHIWHVWLKLLGSQHLCNFTCKYGL